MRPRRGRTQRTKPTTRHLVLDSTNPTRSRDGRCVCGGLAQSWMTLVHRSEPLFRGRRYHPAELSRLFRLCRFPRQWTGVLFHHHHRVRCHRNRVYRKPHPRLLSLGLVVIDNPTHHSSECILSKNQILRCSGFLLLSLFGW